MNIVIVGAGHIGLHLAAILSHKNHDVTLIDIDAARIQEASQSLNIATIIGSGTDWRLLSKLSATSCDLFLSMTDHDATNLVACSMAKQLGFPKTVARINEHSFINCPKLDLAALFQTDYLMAPDLLVATEIFRLMTTQNAIAVENFAHGALQLRTLKIPDSWSHTVPLQILSLPSGIRIGIIRRNETIIFPHGTDRIEPGDEITLLGAREEIEKIAPFFGIPYKKLRSAVLVGGGPIAITLTRLLTESGCKVKLINIDKSQCQELAELFPDCIILHHDASDLNFLLEEQIDRADCFVTCTRHEETNLLVGKLALSAGAQHVIACVANPAYEGLARAIGIHQTVTLHKSFEHQIFSIIKAKKIYSMVFLYDDQVEIVEVKVTENSPLLGSSIAELAPTLPGDLIFAAIQSQGTVSIVTGQSRLQPGDSVITIIHPRHLPMLDLLF